MWGKVYFELTKNPRLAIKKEALCLIWAKEIKMKKLTIALVLVGLLTLPIVGLADPAGPPIAIPPKPGTNTNLGLWNALLKILGNNMPYWWSAGIVDWILYVGTPPWHVGNLYLSGNFTLATAPDKIVLVRGTTNNWSEISRSTN